MKINKWLITSIVIVFVFIITPFIIYFLTFHEFGISKNNANWGSFGSYVSGVTGFITTIITSISVFVLYYTLRITSKYNENQIENNHSQTKISHINLLMELLLTAIKKNSKALISSSDNLDLTTTFLSELNFTMELMKEGKEIDDGSIDLNYNKKIALFLNENKLLTTDEFIINMILFTKEESLNRINLNGVTPVINMIFKIINDENNSSELKSILILMLKSKVHNDIIFWSLIFSSSSVPNMVKNMEGLCTIPYMIKAKLNEIKSQE